MYKDLPGLSKMDIMVIEIMEDLDNTNQHGRFMTSLVNLMAIADGVNLERIGMGFPEVLESFERWKSGQTGVLYHQGMRRLRIVS